MQKWEYGYLYIAEIEAPEDVTKLAVNFFEYRTGETHTYTIYNDTVNKLGFDGWELAAVATNNHRTFQYFKRPLED